MERATAAIPLSVRVRPFIEVNEWCTASHLTAAELHALPQRRQQEPLEVYHLIRPEGAAHLARPHVIVHRMKLFEDEVTTLEGVPVTTPERTWLDMAEFLTLTGRSAAPPWAGRKSGYPNGTCSMMPSPPS
ncbi:hypothetical protein QFZ35_000193 [Arthrobacter ulcerisalmonis]|nr:hypothetical protein [Arthrobacter ulcerisalmonis]MDQ0661695.1 hypothetical protein [Arthrobacter ulcerisalmonis]